MPSLNKVQIIGHLGRDPETKYLPSGDPVASFSIACSEKWKDKGGNPQEHTEWFNVKVFGKSAEFASKYLAKGKLAYIEGKLRTHEYESNGEKKRFTELVADRVLSLAAREKRDEEEPIPF
jgi:single-strand DNA-binding protein